MKGEDKNENVDIANLQQGVSIAVAFIILALILFYNPLYIYNQIITYSIGALFAIFGVIGLGIELTRLGGHKKLGFDNLGVGLVFIIIWVVIFNLYNIHLLNLLMLPFLFFGVYGTVLGVIMFVSSMASNDSSTKKFLIKLPLLLGQLAGFLLAILQILKVMNLIE